MSSKHPEYESSNPLTVAALREISKMAVMKTCCGCLSTKTGTLSILILYSITYIAGIVSGIIDLTQDTIEKDVTDQLSGDQDCRTGEHKDSWWCEAIFSAVENIETVLIVLIAIFAAFLITAVLAVYGTSQGKHWFMLPWIVAKFILLALVGACFVGTIILLSVYKQEDDDSSDIIAFGVILAAVMAFVFYLWLCVVSHFQILREVSKLCEGLEHVQPFTNTSEDSVVDTIHEDHYDQGDEDFGGSLPEKGGEIDDMEEQNPLD